MEFLRAWAEFRGIALRFIDADDQVLVLNEFGGRGRGSGLSNRGMRGAALFTFEGGKVSRLILFTDWDEALEAAGLRE